MKKENRFLEILSVLAAIIVIAAVTAYPFLHEGLYGYAPDYIYHMNRIDGVKEALLAGQYPVYVYSNFFKAKGYGSPMFYPDLFLVIPAVLRIAGLSMLSVYKIFAVLICLIATISTYISLKTIIKDRMISLSGTFLLMLSEFYLADIIFRAGYSSYISYIFIPLLFAGIYDFFMLEGKNTYLIGVGLGGLVLCHIINSFIALLLTTFIFVVLLATKTGRAAIFNKEKILGLIKTAVITILVTGYYTFPMIEQMTSGIKRVYQEPWAKIGEFVQPFETLFLPTGYFFNIAYVGVGIPILLLVGVRIFAGKSKDVFANFYYLLGILLLLSMTGIVPWVKLEDTLLNQLQFTFRIYPFALCVLVFGIALTAKELLSEKSKWPLLIYAVVMTVSFGIWQNQTALSEIYGYFNEVTDELIADNSETVGRGEWLPVSYDVEGLSKRKKVIAEDNKDYKIKYERFDHKVGGTFEVTDYAESFEVPQIYYKGYGAKFTADSGERVKLDCSISENGFISVAMPAELVDKAGTVTVKYDGTVIQKVTLIISILTVICGIAFGIYRRKKAK